ncbi:tetratricopeptide repeat protein [Virgibacillus sp. DJP39]|uniref:tetratricopeptide repeat protein n=1 Tax=Virgibacillus sp. DJP39 TaxID=3409790 RepID=UPI003BB4F5B1
MKSGGININSKLAYALKLRNDGEDEQSRQLLIELVRNNHKHAELNFHCAQTHDGMGLEEEAVEYYEKAIELGLPDDLLRDAFVCLGSTYRVIGQLQQSHDILLKGEKKFPDYEPIKVFKALTLHNIDHHSKALETVLKTLLRTTNDEAVQKYSRALGYYAENLDGPLDESGNHD